MNKNEDMFAIHVGDTPPEGEPVGMFKTPEANLALHHAYEWACSKEESSADAACAKVYIEAIALNREENPANPDEADYVQLLYIISNLTYWRGKHAKESRRILKEYAESIK